MRISDWSSDVCSSDLRSTSDVWGVSLTSSWNVGPFSLKSISAYRDLRSAFAVDSDQSPLNIQRTENAYNQNQFSQEFQLQGNALEQRLNYLYGLYYLHEEGTNRNSIFSAPTAFTNGGAVRHDRSEEQKSELQ